MKHRLLLSLLISLGASLILYADNTEGDPGANPTGGTSATTDGLPSCHNTKLSTECGDCEVCDAHSHDGSVMLNGGLRYMTWSHDYVSRTDASGCSSCGSVNSGNPGARLPELAITRFSDPLSYSRHYLSFGKHMGMKHYDQQLQFTQNHTAITFDDFGAYNSKRAVNFNLALLNWTESNGRRDRGIASLSLFDGAGLPITVAANRDNAHTAVTLGYDGESVHFEVLWDANGKGIARPVAFLDRHGNAIEIDYVDAQPLAGTAVTDFKPYFRKSIIRDAYGREAQFTYEKLFHIYAVTRIDLPNGAHISYDYAWSRGLVLEKATHADGTESIWSRFNNTATKLTEYNILDAKSDPGHRRKTVHFSQGQGFAPGGGTLSTVWNRVRRAQNGTGEFIWDSRGDSTDLSDRYIYEGGNSVRKLTFPDNSYGLTKVEHVTNDDWIGDFHSGDSSTWLTETALANRQNNNAHFPLSRKDARNRDKSNVRDPLSLEVVSNNHADASSSSMTRNQFSQPLVSTDRLGRITTRSYSPLGDLLTETRGTGSFDETTKTYLYNTRGQVIEARDALYDANIPELHNTRYEYNTAGYLTKKIDSADLAGGTRPENLFTYDTAGRLTTTTDPEGRVITYGYDDENRLVQTTYNDSSTELVEYGTGLEANLVVKTTDRNGIETTYAYDAADRRIETITAANTSDPSIETCTYLTGTRKKLSCTINGETTDYLYDHRNRVIATTVRPTATKTLVTNTEYDELTRTRSTTDAYGRKTFYLYDQNDRVTRKVKETVPGALAAPAFTLGAAQSSQSKVYTLTDKDGNPLDSEDTHEVTYTDPRDLFLQNLTRDLTVNAAYLITDAIHDAAGQTIITTDARGNNTWKEYDELGRTTLSIAAVGTPSEIVSEQDYDDNSNLVEVRNPRHFEEAINAVDQYSYNGRNLRASHTTAPSTPEQATQSWTYYLDGRNDEHTDFRGNIAKQIWHACCGRLQAMIDRDDMSTRVNNTDYLGQVTHTATLSTNPLGNWHDPVQPDTIQETTTRFDGRGRPTHTTQWLVALGNVVDHARANLNNGVIPIAGLDGIPASNGLTTTYAYDDDLTDGAGIDADHAAAIAELTTAGITFGTDSNGYAAKVTNPEGESSVHISDGIGRTVMQINPEGDTTLAAYDVIEIPTTAAADPVATPVPGSLLKVSSTDANGNTTSSYSDAAGRTIAALDAAGNASYAAYNANSSIVSTRDSNGLGQDCTFDALNRDTSCADLQEQSETASRTKTYNAASQIVSSTNAQGHITTNIYDVRNRLTKSTDPNLIDTEYTYDANNNLVSLTDGNGNTRSWDYNSRNLKSRKTNPGAGDILDYAYDALRRLALKIDQDNNHHESEYDMASRLLKRVYKTGGSATESEDTFTYDKASRLTATTKGRYSVSTAHTYAADSLPLTESISYQGKTYTTARSYDAGNRPINQTFQDGKVQYWNYDSRNLVTSVDYETKNILSQSHDDAYRLNQQTLGNGLTRTLQYGRSDNLRTTDTVFDGISAIDELDLSYTYAVDKQITAETVAGGVMQNASFSASYDDGNRVTGWTRPGSIAVNAPEQQSWNYDDAGNWNSTTIDGDTTNRSHSVNNELTSVGSDATTVDDRGNLTEDNQNNLYIYDLDNRVKEVQMDSNTDVEMVYDALGRRVHIDNGSDETFFTWWGNQEVAEHEHNSTQSTIQNDLWAHPTTLNTICARAVEGSKYKLEWYHKNYLDHVYAVSDDNGNITEHYRYNAFGEVEIYSLTGTKLTVSSIDNKVTWNSRRYDSDTKLHYYKYRHYSPELGRWLGRDPVSERGGLNIYGFVVNDGINRRDMLGLSPDAPDCCKTEKKIWEVWTTAEIAANSIWIAAVLHEQYLVDQLAIFEAKLGPAQDDVNEKAQILLSANLAMPGLCMAGPISCAAGGVAVKKAYDMHITALGVLGGIKAVLEHLPAGIEAAAQDKQQKQSIWSHAFREMYKAESNYNVCVYKRDNP